MDKIFADLDQLTKGLEFSQDQLYEEIDIVKKEIEKPYRNIKCIENDFLDPEEVSSKLVELGDKVPS